MDGGVWQATVHGVAKNRTQLSNVTHSLAHTTSRTCAVCSLKDSRHFPRCNFSYPRSVSEVVGAGEAGMIVLTLQKKGLSQSRIPNQRQKKKDSFVNLLNADRIKLLCIRWLLTT